MRVLFPFLRRDDGVAMIEFAIIIPVIVTMMLGVLEFGMFFLKSQMNQRNLASASVAVSADPNDPSARQLLTQNELLRDRSNRYCAHSYVTQEQAQSAVCPGGWVTSPPANLPAGQKAYYVLIESTVNSQSMTGMFDGIIPVNVARQVVKIGDEEKCSRNNMRIPRCYSAVENLSISTNLTTPCEKWEDTNCWAGPTGWTILTQRQMKSEPAECVNEEWSCADFAAEITKSTDTSTKLGRGCIDMSPDGCRAQGYSSRTETRVVPVIKLPQNEKFPSGYSDCIDLHSQDILFDDSQQNTLQWFIQMGRAYPQTSGAGYNCWGGPTR